MKSLEQLKNRLEKLKELKLEQCKKWETYGNLEIRINDWEGIQKENRNLSEIMSEIDFIEKAIAYLF